MVLTHKILYNQKDLEATQLFKFSRRPWLRKSSLKLFRQTGRTRRRRNSFACRVVYNWNRLPLTAQIQKNTRLIYLLLSFSFNSILTAIWSFRARCPSPISKYLSYDDNSTKPGLYIMRRNRIDDLLLKVAAVVQAQICSL